MKILIEHHKTHPFNPNKTPGGLEVFINNLFSLLQDSEHEVSIATVEGGPGGEGVIELPFDAHRRLNRFNYAKWYGYLQHISKDFDKVILSQSLTSKVLCEYPKLCSKAIYIQHDCWTITPNGMNQVHWGNLKFIQHMGGITLSPNQWVANTAAQSVKSREQYNWGSSSLHKSLEPQEHILNEGVKQLFTGSFDVLQHRKNTVGLKPVNEKKIVWIGRPQSSKGFLTGVKALLHFSKEGYECHIYTNSTHEDFKTQLNKGLDLLEGSSVKVHLNLPHAEIMESLSDTNVLLWTTRDETAGLVGYEGVLHGCRVIYGIDPPDYHIGGDHVFKRKWSSLKQLINITKEVMVSPFDREACSQHFREKYTPEKDLKRLEQWLNYEPQTSRMSLRDRDFSTEFWA